MTSHDPTGAIPQAWHQQLDAFIALRTRTSFNWGEHDCCLFAADAVQSFTGVDHAAGWRGKYRTEEQAAVVLEQLGGLEACGALAGPEVPPLMAQAGDVGLVSDGYRDLLGVCVGANWLVPAKYGLAALPITAARKAWRVARG